MLPANRPGALRGPNGATLDDIVSALRSTNPGVGLYAALNDILAELQVLNQRLGNPATGTCAIDFATMLCTLVTEVVGTTGNPTIPPAVCPGFEGGITFGPVDFAVAPVSGGEGSIYNYASFAAAPAPFPFIGQNEPWGAAANGAVIPFFILAGQLGTVLDVCITLVNAEPVGGISLYYLNNTGEVVSDQALTTNGVTGTTTHSVTLDAGTLYVLWRQGDFATPAQIQAYITIAPVG